MSYMQRGDGGGALMNAAQTGRLAFIQKVYGVFLTGILISVAAATLVIKSPAVAVLPGPNNTAIRVPSLVMFSVDHMLLGLLLFFGTFFLASAMRRKPGVNLLLMYLFTGVSGAFIAPQVWVKTITAPGAVELALAITTLMFVGLSAYSALTKRSFNFLGAGLFVALLGLIGGSLLNGLFFHSSWALMMMAWGAVVIFTGFILYDTQKIMNEYPESEYIAGALNLYLDFINLFLAILRILGGNRR